MSMQINPYVLLLILSALLSVFLAALAWRRRPAPGATTLALLMIALGGWAAAYAMELISASLPDKLFWAKVQYISFLAIPALWLVFVLQYSGRQKVLTPRRLALLAIMPLVTLILVWTTERHGLIYRDVVLSTNGPYPLLLTYGPFFWVQGIYSYALFLFATGIVLLTFLSGPRIQRSQSAALLVGALAPLLGNALYVARAGPFPDLDLAPMLFFVTGAAALWGLLRYRFLDLLPVARDALIDGMSDGVAVIDARGRVVDLNNAAWQIVDRSGDDTVLGAYAATALPGWIDLEQSLGSVPELQTEIELLAGEISRVWELRVTPLAQKRGQFTGWLAVYRDITASKRAAQIELQQRRLLEALRDATATLTSTLSLDEVLDRILEQTDAVVPHDMSNIMLIEDGWATVARARGYDGRQAAAAVASLRLCVQETANLRWMREMRQPMAVADLTIDQDWDFRPNLTWIRSYAAAPILSRGEVIGFLNLDSEQPDFFNQGHAQALQTFANQAGIAIENARLYASLQDVNAQLLIALAAREAAVKNVSHELRTPLTILMGYIELLESGQIGALTNEQLEALRIMGQQSRRLVFMVNSLLMLQTFDSETLPVSPLDLCEWLPGTIESWRYLVEDTQIEFRLQMPRTLPLVLGAANYLEMVIGSLIDNAVKFSPQGREITIAAQNDGADVVISVADQGVGIAPEQLGMIFDRFYQVDSTSTRRFGGMGVGLALCKTIVAAHHGRMWAESAGQDQGSTVYFTLPVFSVEDGD